MRSELTRELAAHFATIALSHVTREYPAKMDHVLTGPADVAGPRVFHPAFHGSFDWHSCVHGFWLLAKILRMFPTLPGCKKIKPLFNAKLTPENIAAEIAYLNRPMQQNFERPYGWAWLLMLASELARHQTEEAHLWKDAVWPMAQGLAGRLSVYLSKLPFPIRAGTHANTAFAVVLGMDFAEASQDAELAGVLRSRARQFFGNDRDFQAQEPSGNDFHSPILIEAECMRRVLPTGEFAPWLERFLPRLGKQEPGVLFDAVEMSDSSDPQLVHLDGLNFSRAWCWRMLAGSFASNDPRRALAEAAAEKHIAQSVPNIAKDYMGEHWLATYAMLALTS
jgi:hypothetical protein